MATWRLTPALAALNAEIARVAPGRDRRSDGTVGDDAHGLVVSDHNPDETGAVPIHDADSVNEVHATDRDSTGPWPWPNGMRALVLFLAGRHRHGLENRLRYIIHDGTIWSASSGWIPRKYIGENPHTEHAHFSGSYDTSRENDTSSWHLEEIPVALTDPDLDKIRTIAREESRAAVDARVGDRIPYFDAASKQVSGTDNDTIDGGTALYRIMRDLLALRAMPGAVVEAMEDQYAAMSDDQVASYLRAILGTRAAAVGALMAAGE